MTQELSTITVTPVLRYITFRREDRRLRRGGLQKQRTSRLLGRYLTLRLLREAKGDSVAMTLPELSIERDATLRAVFVTISTYAAVVPDKRGRVDRIRVSFPVSPGNEVLA